MNKSGPVSRRPVTLGPANSAKSTNGLSVSTCSGLPGIPPDPPMISRMPPDEMANTSAK